MIKMMILRIKMELVMVMIIMMATKIGGSCVFFQATRTRATATAAVGSRRATPTPIPTAPPTTTMVIIDILDIIEYGIPEKRYHTIFCVLYEGGGHGFYTSPSEGTKSSGGQV